MHSSNEENGGANSKALLKATIMSSPYASFASSVSDLTSGIGLNFCLDWRYPMYSSRMNHDMPSAKVRSCKESFKSGPLFFSLGNFGLTMYRLGNLTWRKESPIAGLPEGGRYS